MNCLDFRRQLHIDPHSMAADFLAHRAECARCAQALQRALAFETALRTSLAVPAPPQLADAILLAQATRHRHQMQRRGALLALAAAVLLAFGVISVNRESSALPALAVQHLNKEAFVLGMKDIVPDAEVRKAFAESGIAIKNVPAGISFVYCCPVGRYHSVHLVMPSSTGPVTVLYLLEDAAKSRENFAREGWQGRDVPLAHGTLVLLAHDASQFDRIEQAWRAALGNSA